MTIVNYSRGKSIEIRIYVRNLMQLMRLNISSAFEAASCETLVGVACSLHKAVWYTSQLRPASLLLWVFKEIVRHTSCDYL